VGFCVYYRTTRAVTAAEAEAIDQAAARLCDEPDWGDGCEEIGFYECLTTELDGAEYVEGHLSGSSKLSWNEWRKLSDDWLNDNPAVPGGLLKSKPT
jgi:hypothetical protein